MAAKDYEICCGMFKAYIARVSKRDTRLMLNDRREISEGEKLTLIAWELEQWCYKNEGADGFRFEDNNGRTIEVHYVQS